MKSNIAVILSASLILTSPGLPFYQAWAQARAGNEKTSDIQTQSTEVRPIAQNLRLPVGETRPNLFQQNRFLSHPNFMPIRGLLYSAQPQIAVLNPSFRRAPHLQTSANTAVLGDIPRVESSIAQAKTLLPLGVRSILATDYRELPLAIRKFFSRKLPQPTSNNAETVRSAEERRWENSAGARSETEIQRLDNISEFDPGAPGAQLQPPTDKAAPPPSTISASNPSEPNSNGGDANHNSTVPPPEPPAPSLLHSPTIYRAFAFQIFKFALVVGPLLWGIFFPGAFMTFPQFYMAYDFVRQLIMLSYILPPWPIFVGLLSGAALAAIFYSLRSTIGLWMTEDAEAESPKIHWYSILRHSPLESEFLDLPNTMKEAKRNSGYEQVEGQRDDIIAVRLKNFSRLGAMARLTLYYDWVGEIRFLNNVFVGFLKHFGEQIRVGRFRPAKWLFFVFTAWFRTYWELSEMSSLLWKRIRGEEISLLYRVRPNKPRRELDLPPELRSYLKVHFETPQLVTIQSPKDRSDNALFLENIGPVRLINAGSHAKGVLDLSDPTVRRHFIDRQAWWFKPIPSDVADVAGTGVAGYLYFADENLPKETKLKYADKPMEALAAVAVENLDGNPFEDHKGVQKDGLPPILKARIIDPMAEKKKISNVTWGIALAASAGLVLASIVLSFGFLQPGLSSAAHVLGGATVALGLLFLRLFVRTLRKQTPRWLAHRTLAAFGLASWFIISSIGLVSAGPLWYESPRAQSLSNAASKITSILRHPQLGINASAPAPVYGAIPLRNTDPLVEDTRAAGTPAVAAAGETLRQLAISPEVRMSYEKRVSGSESSQAVRTIVSLMAYCASEDLLPREHHDRLLRSLLDVHDNRYGKWMKTELVPLLRKALIEKGIPVPNSPLTWAQISDDKLLYLVVSDAGIAPPGTGDSPDKAAPSWSVIDVTPVRPPTIIDDRAVAGAAAASPLRSLKIDPALAQEYEKRVSGRK